MSDDLPTFGTPTTIIRTGCPAHALGGAFGKLRRERLAHKRQKRPQSAPRCGQSAGERGQAGARIVIKPAARYGVVGGIAIY